MLNVADDSIKDIRVIEINGTFADLHGKELVFTTSARPAARYLYFQYLIAMLRARKHGTKMFKPKPPQDDKNDGYNGSTDTCPFPSGTPGPYMRERMVRVLVAEAGHKVFAERDFQERAIPERNRRDGCGGASCRGWRPGWGHRNERGVTRLMTTVARFVCSCFVGEDDGRCIVGTLSGGMNYRCMSSLWV